MGAMFRTADGAGVSKLFLCGYTPAPVDRFRRPQPKIIKTSLGASETVAWDTAADAVDVVTSLQAAGVSVIALEQTQDAIELSLFTPPPAVAYVVGNEVDGVSPAVLALVDASVVIPMRGQKESLNVATAAGIMMYHGT